MSHHGYRMIWQVDTQVIKARNRAELDREINLTLRRLGSNPFNNEPMWEPISVTAKRGKFYVTYRGLVMDPYIHGPDAGRAP